MTEGYRCPVCGLIGCQICAEAVLEMQAEDRAEIERLKAEIERLRGDLQSLILERDQLLEVQKGLNVEIERLRVELERISNTDVPHGATVDCWL